ncbi:hypothetical protein Gorai_011538, partial [Gossypium raimondii]|nr:hypothetical protein [Gossypium raimondii]
MMIPSGSKAIKATFGSLVETNVNYPPVMAVIEAVEALSPKQNLELSFTFSKTTRLDHVELYLSGYDLDDPLPDFSQMDDALEAIDLRNNHLDGPIPDVLGKLLNLTLLIGSSNNQSESKRLALIIVLAVGLPIFFLFILALVFLLVRKQKTSTQVQVTAAELG